MNTLIISSSISPTSRSLVLCTTVAKALEAKGAIVDVVDARLLDLVPYHKPITPSMEEVMEKVRWADNIVIGMGVHSYSFNDTLKIIMDGTFMHATGKFFGILCAAGGHRSYLTTMQVTQICMSEWRMIQLPRIVYATKHEFTDGKISAPEIEQRLEDFVEEFYTIGGKLLA